MLKLANRNDRRAGGRVHCSEVMSSLGPVLDLSGTGMRVWHEGWRKPKPGQQFEMDVWWQEERVHLVGEVVWSRRGGLMSYSVGVRFMQLDEATRAGLSRIGMVSASESVYRRTGS